MSLSVLLKAEAVLRSVHELGEPAHFVIIGCSGSGKTESAKLLFQYFAESRPPRLLSICFFCL